MLNLFPLLSGEDAVCLEDADHGSWPSCSCSQVGFFNGQKPPVRQYEVSALRFWKHINPVPVQIPRRYGILAINNLRLGWVPNTHLPLSHEEGMGF